MVLLGEEGGGSEGESKFLIIQSANEILKIKHYKKHPRKWVWTFRSRSQTLPTVYFRIVSKVNSILFLDHPTPTGYKQEQDSMDIQSLMNQMNKAHQTSSTSGFLTETPSQNFPCDICKKTF